MWIACATALLFAAGVTSAVLAHSFWTASGADADRNAKQWIGTWPQQRSRSCQSLSRPTGTKPCASSCIRAPVDKGQGSRSPTLTEMAVADRRAHIARGLPRRRSIRAPTDAEVSSEIVHAVTAAQWW